MNPIRLLHQKHLMNPTTPYLNDTWSNWRLWLLKWANYILLSCHRCKIWMPIWYTRNQHLTIEPVKNEYVYLTKFFWHSPISSTFVPILPRWIWMASPLVPPHMTLSSTLLLLNIPVRSPMTVCNYLPNMCCCSNASCRVFHLATMYHLITRSPTIWILPKCPPFCC